MNEEQRDIEKLLFLLGVTLDETKDYIDQLQDLLVVDFIKEDLIKILQELLAVKQDKHLDVSFIRVQLKNIIDFYKVKGTERSFQSVITAIGFNSKVIPLWTPDKEVLVEIEQSFITFVMPNIILLGLDQNTYNVKVENPDAQYDVAYGAITFSEG